MLSHGWSFISHPVLCQVLRREPATVKPSFVFLPCIWHRGKMFGTIQGMEHKKLMIYIKGDECYNTFGCKGDRMEPI